MLYSNTRGNEPHLTTLPGLRHPVAARGDDQISAVARAPPQEPTGKGVETDGRVHEPQGQPSTPLFVPPSGTVPGLLRLWRALHRPQPIGEGKLVDAQGITDADEPLR